MGEKQLTKATPEQGEINVSKPLKEEKVKCGVSNYGVPVSSCKTALQIK